MTSITQASPRYMQELATILCPQNRTQGSCVLDLFNFFLTTELQMESQGIESLGYQHSSSSSDHRQHWQKWCSTVLLWRQLMWWMRWRRKIILVASYITVYLLKMIIVHKQLDFYVCYLYCVFQSFIFKKVTIQLVTMVD